MNGTLETIGGRPALRFERRFAYPVERVWRAITEPDELERWFIVRPEWTPAAGETFEAMGETGEITECTPPHLFAYTWGGESLRFELRPDRDGCVLVFVHVFDDRSRGAQHAAGWHVHFERLDAFLEGAYISEAEAIQRFPEAHERYAERFGLDPEVGRRALAEIHGIEYELGA